MIYTIHLVRKPQAEPTVEDNHLAWETGALNIDACRLAVGGEEHMRPYQPSAMAHSVLGKQKRFQPTNSSGGRFPTNLVLEHREECECMGLRQVKGKNPTIRTDGVGKGIGEVYGSYSRGRPAGLSLGYADEDGLERVEEWDCVEGCPVKNLDEQSGFRPSSSLTGRADPGVVHGRDRKPDGSDRIVYGYGGGWVFRNDQIYADGGGASRFFKQVGGQKE